MVRVKVSTSFPGWPLARQTPGASSVWGDYRFMIDQPIEECDWWVVYEGPLKVEHAHCPPENTVFISSEPPSLARYPRPFLEQFATVITCQPRVRHPDVRLTQQALPWHIGAYFQCPGRRPLTYDDFKRARFDKTRCLSVVSSNKALTRGHRLRLRFVQELQRRLKDKVDVFGRGIRDIDDKWEAIAPYKYHVSIENSVVPHYWTEKLSDAFLGHALPFYYGCPNIGEYFAADAFVRIDIADPGGSIDVIEETIASGAFERAQGALAVAREQVLDCYNLFSVLERLFSEPRRTSAPRRLKVLPRGMLEAGPAAVLRKVARRLPAPIKRLLK